MPFLEKKSILDKPAIRPFFLNLVTFGVCYHSFFLVDVQNFDGTDFFLENNGQKEFQIPLADRADQVLPLIVPFFWFFTSFKSYVF